MMPGANYVKYGYCFAIATPGVSLYQSLTLDENIVAVITQNRVIYKGNIQYISNWSKLF